jgi:DNA-3-methyladenine glycosylase
MVMKDKRAMKKELKYEGERLGPAFYRSEDVVAVSKALLGKYLVTSFGAEPTVGRIVETEAYRGPDDKACHAYNNRYTDRTRVMFAPGGRAYVYLCYGIHHLFNVVTGAEGMPHAVLIRAIEPVENIGRMLERRGWNRPTPKLTAGPGMLTQALGITTAHSGMDLTVAQSKIWIEDRGDKTPESTIIAGPRVGVAYAEECALWPWRFRIRDSQWTSPAK